MYLTVALYICIAFVTVSVNGRELVIEDKLASQQIKDLKAAGYDPARLDHHTQLKVFLYTWLAMERAEGGLCHSCVIADAVCASFTSKAQHYKQIGHAAWTTVWTANAAPWCDKSNTAFCKGGPVICCTGWSKVMSICTRDNWYNGQDGTSVKATAAEITRIIKV